jgi:hypothetical protein
VLRLYCLCNPPGPIITENDHTLPSHTAWDVRLSRRFAISPFNIPVILRKSISHTEYWEVFLLQRGGIS